MWGVLLQLQKGMEMLEEPNERLMLACSKALTQSPALGSVSHSLGCVPGGWTQGNRKTHARVFFVNLGPRNGAVTWLRRRVMEGPDDRDEDGAVVSEYSWKSGWQDLMLLLRCGGSRGK